MILLRFFTSFRMTFKKMLLWWRTTLSAHTKCLHGRTESCAPTIHNMKQTEKSEFEEDYDKGA